MESGSLSMKIRNTIRREDVDHVRAITVSTGFFTMAESEVAAGLAREALEKGPESGYYFLFAEEQGLISGFACFGPTPCTEGSWDLYWIAVRNERRGLGTGRLLLAEAEKNISRYGGRKIFIETSSRDLYLPTRQFYLRCGYREEARVADFYADGDDKLIYSRRTVS